VAFSENTFRAPGAATAEILDSECPANTSNSVDVPGKPGETITATMDAAAVAHRPTQLRCEIVAPDGTPLARDEAARRDPEPVCRTISRDQRRIAAVGDVAVRYCDAGSSGSAETRSNPGAPLCEHHPGTITASPGRLPRPMSKKSDSDDGHHGGEIRACRKRRWC
jgi:hypothetical protein